MELFKMAIFIPTTYFQHAAIFGEEGTDMTIFTCTLFNGNGPVLIRGNDVNIINEYTNFDINKVDIEKLDEYRFVGESVYQGLLNTKDFFKMIDCINDDGKYQYKIEAVNERFIPMRNYDMYKKENVNLNHRHTLMDCLDYSKVTYLFKHMLDDYHNCLYTAMFKRTKLTLIIAETIFNNIDDLQKEKLTKMYDVFVYVKKQNHIKLDGFEYIKQGCRGMNTYNNERYIDITDAIGGRYPTIFIFDDTEIFDVDLDDVDFGEDFYYMSDPDRQVSCLRFHLSQDHVYPDIVPARYEIENEYYPDIIKIKDCAEINNIVDFFTKSRAPEEYPNWIKKHIV